MFDSGMWDSGTWFWVWAVLAAFFFVGEIFTAAFFMMPFGMGATVAALLAYFQVGVGYQWAAFIVVSGVSVALLRHYSRRFTTEPPEKMGAERLVGLEGIVVEELITHSPVGQVLVQHENWRAEAPGHDLVPVDTRVIVEGIEGTHLIVRPRPAEEGEGAQEAPQEEPVPDVDETDVGAVDTEE